MCERGLGSYLQTRSKSATCRVETVGANVRDLNAKPRAAYLLMRDRVFCIYRSTNHGGSWAYVNNTVRCRGGGGG